MASSKSKAAWKPRSAQTERVAERASADHDHPLAPALLHHQPPSSAALSPVYSLRRVERRVRCEARVHGVVVVPTTRLTPDQQLRMGGATLQIGLTDGWGGP